jgi:hypothetical protein
LQVGMVAQHIWPEPPHIACATQVPPVQVLPSVQVLPGQHESPLVPHAAFIMHLPFWQVVPAAVHVLLVQHAWARAPQLLLLLPPPQPARAAITSPARTLAYRFI